MRSDISPILGPFAHLGIGYTNQNEVDKLCEQVINEGILAKEPVDSGYTVGYWVFISGLGGYTLDLSYGQEIGLTVKNLQEKNTKERITVQACTV